MKLPLHGPRAVRIRPEFMLNVILAEVVIGGVLLLATLVFGENEHSIREVRTRGKPVQGTATTQRVKSAPRRGETAFELPYRYKVNGKEYTGKSPVTLETFYSTPAQGAVTVWYLPEKPEISTLSVAVAQDDQFPIRIFLFGFAGVVGAATLAFRGIALRERKILRDWTAVPVTVARIEERQIGDYAEYETALVEKGAEEPRQWTFITRTVKPDEEGKETILFQNPENPRQVRRLDQIHFAESRRDDPAYL